MKCNLFHAALAAILLASPMARAKVRFTWTNLNSDIHGVAPNQDDALHNPIGIAPGPLGAMHIADNSTGYISVYDPLGFPRTTGTAPARFQIPVSGTSIAAPTGIVLNLPGFSAATDFVITSGTLSGNSHYVVVTEDGIVAGINPEVSPTQAVVAASNPDAIYKGAALAYSGSDHRLYVANFKSGQVEVFDTHFNPITSGSTPSGVPFQDPNPVPGFAPFNIKRIVYHNPKAPGNDQYLLVTYAQPDTTGSNAVAGAGTGYANLFRPDGTFLRRLIGQGADVAGCELNSPWGMAVSPANPASSWGRWSREATRAGWRPPGHILLVGNSGDGRINSYRLGLAPDGTPQVEAPLGQLTDPRGRPLEFENLWALQFGRFYGEGLRRFFADEDELMEIGDLYFTAGLVEQTTACLGELTCTPIEKWKS